MHRVSTDESGAASTCRVNGKRIVLNPWEVVATDLMSPFPKSPSGYEYVLIIEDLFTHWVEEVPLRKANARAIIKALKECVIYRHGTPNRMLTDNGTEFRNRDMDQFLEKLRFTIEFIPPNHAQDY